MNYVIDPRWVYWLSVFDGVKGFMLALGCILWVVCAALSVYYLMYQIDDDLCTEEEREKKKRWRKWLISGVIAGGVLLLACVFIPSQDTLIAMKVAELATKDNVTLTADALKNIVDYVVDAIKTIKEV